MRRPCVDLSACTLCMGCVEVCPEVFSQNDVGFIEVADLQEFPQACIEEAIKYCPEDAIAWDKE